jgi:acyl carrier protein
MNTYQKAFICLQQFLTRTFTLPCRSLTPEQQLQDTLGLSELEIIEAVNVLETHFGVVLPDEALTSRLTVGELCTLIDQHTEHAERET